MHRKKEKRNESLDCLEVNGNNKLYMTEVSREYIHISILVVQKLTYIYQISLNIMIITINRNRSI